MKKIPQIASLLFLLYVTILSVINIILKYRISAVASIIVSVIGVASVVLFISKRSTFKYFILAWILAQALIVYHTSLIAGVVETKPIFDLTQVLNLKIGFFVTSGSEAYNVYFNVLVIPYFFFLRTLKATLLSGKTYNLFFLKDNNDIRFNVDTSITFVRPITLDDDDNWMLGLLSNTITINNTIVDRLLVRIEDGVPTNIFRLVPQNLSLTETTFSLLGFERADWIKFE